MKPADQSGKCSSVVEARLLRFWEARNVKRGGELMWVDMLLLDVNVNIMGGGPVPVQVKTGESSSDAEKSANENAAGDAPKKRTHPSIKEVKKTRVA
ncbi:hypothetical protein Bca52824_036533 [Brassica carinata]|uniref:Uncharacterized protein n=1 Tax=Brassica carinata TaxID=52824 RepID=A0A8X7V3U1_BRACI|nr:hypothetical protein Bca52824_036533 [Brassica carinata]